MSVTAARGFRASGISAGLKESGRPDLGLLVADAPAAAAGLFTTNAFPAAPVVLSRLHLAGGACRAVVVNSGQANAGTGEPGMADARATAAAAGELLGTGPGQVLVCSTGVIGPRVKMGELLAGLPVAVEALDDGGGPGFARAILTTDREPKEVVVHADGFVVGGCAKGAGMIAPDLATMLVFLTTDAAIDPPLLDEVTRAIVGPVFNGLTVDGCTSTNDTVLVLASGGSGVEAAPGSRALAVLEAALGEAAEELARQIVADAEGATSTLVVHVSGAASADEARAAGKAVAGSLLVKTAVFGGDPNPGRLLQAVGASGASLDPMEVSISLAGHRVIEAGRVVAFDEAACAEALKEREVVIRADLGAGDAEATCFGCDLGYEYVRINAEYTT